MTQKNPFDFKNLIQWSGKTIYDPIEIGDPDYWIPSLQLETLVKEGLQGKVLKDVHGRALPNRTRSKIIKVYTCEALGYPVPKSFKKTQPRFVGQQFDTYAQKSMNLQIWNEGLSPSRRYVIIQVSEDDTVLSVKVINGQELALLDTTGTLTTKYQARLETRADKHELISVRDTDPMLLHVRLEFFLNPSTSPTDEPESGLLFPVGELFNRLSPLVGQSFTDPGMDQERNRGAALHNLICKQLGYSCYGDKGTFPDVRHQLLEVKLQTSPTIDLGLVLPDSQELMDTQRVGDYHPRHCDTRYAMFYANTDGISVTLTHLYVTTGADFFKRFRRFEGNIINSKIQIPLPRNFFS
ncbi:restriction endonuclease [Methyloglobulus sp.]|uniref:restriction endonuclease n=1 Tax=Methyloglobulus sp. TaxID=2518622 RepID=UPI0032B84688